MKRKILIVCPVVPYPENGAEQSDRANGIRQLVRLGFDVEVIAKRRSHQSDSDIERFSQSVGNVSITTVPYKYAFWEQSFMGKVRIVLKRLLRLSYLDGAAFEFSDPEIQTIVDKKTSSWKPDIMWFEYTYLWPLFHIPLRYGIPIVTRSLNYEPGHFLDENGRTFLNRIKFLPKYLSEKKVVKHSSLICAITPFEEKIYKRLRAKNVITIPLRGLHKLEEHLPRSGEIIKEGPINLFFMGSTYNVSHNKEAAKFIIEKLAPTILAKFGMRFIFYILGAKLPKDLANKITPNTIYASYVQDLDGFLKNMDCAIVPSLYGAGMQQKIFEPLIRGFPTLVSSRGLAEYPFVENKEVLCADTIEEYVFCLKKIENDYAFLVSLGEQARIKAIKLFDQEVIDKILSQALDRL